MSLGFLLLSFYAFRMLVHRYLFVPLTQMEGLSVLIIFIVGVVIGFGAGCYSSHMCKRTNTRVTLGKYDIELENGALHILSQNGNSQTVKLSY